MSRLTTAIASPPIIYMSTTRKLILAAIIYLSAFRLAPAAGAVSTAAINEFVPDGNPEWVEFYNASSSAEYLKNYYLDDDTSFTDDSGSSTKKLLTGLATSNPTFPFIELSSMLNNSGDSVVLFDPSGNIVDQYSYSSNPGKEISIGRNPDNSGTFFTLASPTKGNTNSPPQPSATPPPAPTSAPAPTLKPTSTPKPAAASTPTPEPAVTLASPTGKISLQVLAETDENSGSEPEINLDITNFTATAEAEIEASPTSQPEKTNRSKLPVIISAAGIILMLGGGLPLIWSELKSRKGIIPQ